MLKLIKQDLCVPSRLEFALRLGVAARLSAKEQSLANYLLEISFLDYDLNKHVHSKVAAAALHLTLQVASAAFWW